MSHTPPARGGCATQLPANGMSNNKRLSFGLVSLLTWGACLNCTARLGFEPIEESVPTSMGGDPGTGGTNDPDAGTGGTKPIDEDPDVGMPPVAPTNFSCDPSQAGASPPLRRLTRLQYESTLRDLFSQALGDQEASSELMQELSGELEKLIGDERVKVPEDLHGSYRRLDQSVQQVHVDSWFEIGKRAGELLSSSDYIEGLLGSCSAEGEGSAADECIDSFVERFGRLALRRPLSSEESDFYRTFYAPSTGIDPEGVADVVAGFLNAPGFLYQIEHGADPAAGVDVTFELSAYELASRLSYHFWNTMPDEELFALAESGDLLDEDTYQAQVERLWSDERTYETVSQFYLEWLKLEDVPELDRNNDTAVFQNFAGDELPSDELRQAMIDEAVDMLNYYTWQQPAGLEQVVLSSRSFARSSELASLYGVEPWDGVGEPPLIEHERPGLLTRAAFLSTGSPNTRPIMKGVFIRTNILCDQVPPPPDNANAMPPELSEDSTTREVVEAVTESSAGCAYCHQRFINPLGFATEGFDSLGRAREEQVLFDEDGEVAGSKQVDTRSVPQVILDDPTEISGPGELMELIAQSGKLEACFARHYFRFTFGRFENVAADGCILEDMRTSLEETGSLADMLRDSALGEAFRRRTFVPSDASDGGQ